MKILSAQECPQTSPEWWEARKGKVTASGADRILTAKTMKPSAQQEDYIAELIADMNCLCPPYFSGQGRPVNTHAMANGKEAEPEARALYALNNDAEIMEVGLLISDCGRFACSPDGLVLVKGEIAGGLELKRPLPKTHAAYLLKGELPAEYIAQVHHSLVVSGLPWWDFMSSCPGFDDLTIRVTPNAWTEALRAELERFWVKYKAALHKVYPELAALEECKAKLADWLTKKPTPEAVNAALREKQELGGLRPEAKRAVWPILLAHGESQGWKWNSEAKEFQPLAF